MDKETKALQLRAKARALMQEAGDLDGLKPYGVTHGHEYGSSTYLVWATEAPSEEDAAHVLEEEFEPDRGETLDIEDSFTLEELVGVSVAGRLLESMVGGKQHDADGDGFDPFQQIVLKSYNGGDHLVVNPGDQAECGDSLLKFLLIELSEQEDCDCNAVAVQRLESAIRQLKEVKQAFMK